jgi:hypothetical protein
MVGIELKSGEAHSSYTCPERKAMLVSRDQSMGNWLIIQNIDSQIAERMILLRSNNFFYFANIGNTTERNATSVFSSNCFEMVAI